MDAPVAKLGARTSEDENSSSGGPVGELRSTSADGAPDWPLELRETVRSAVEVHLAGDQREESAKRRILRELTRLERPFDEFAGTVHVTGSALIVGRRGTVLHLHKRLGRWMQPGGHVDAPEAPWEAALREAQEETGLVLSHPDAGYRLLHLDVHEAAKGHTHLDFRYLLLASDADPSPPPGESPDARWYDWDEALALTDDSLIGALRVAQRQPEASEGLPDNGGTSKRVDRVNGGEL